MIIARERRGLSSEWEAWRECGECERAESPVPGLRARDLDVARVECRACDGD